MTASALPSVLRLPKKTLSEYSGKMSQLVEARLTTTGAKRCGQQQHLRIHSTGAQLVEDMPQNRSNSRLSVSRFRGSSGKKHPAKLDCCSGPIETQGCCSTVAGARITTQHGVHFPAR